MTGFGIVGSGVVAEFHRQAILTNREKGARLAAVASRNRRTFREKSVRFGAPCMTFEELLKAPDVDVVCLCSPSGLHAPQALAAARAGKHVLVEKPMALRLADADAVIESFDRAGLLLGVALQRRTFPLFARMRQAIEAGDLGELVAGSVIIPYLRGQDYYDGDAWRGTWSMDGGGALMNQGIHLVDLLVWYMGDPVEVLARAGTLRREIEVEDCVSATLRFANGAMAAILATTAAAPGFPHSLSIYGDRGGIETEGESLRRWDLADPGAAKVAPLKPQDAAQAGAGADPKAIGHAGHAALIANFIDALQGKASLAADGREGRRGLATALAVYEAAYPRDVKTDG